MNAPRKLHFDSIHNQTEIVFSALVFVRCDDDNVEQLFIFLSKTVLPCTKVCLRAATTTARVFICVDSQMETTERESAQIANPDCHKGKTHIDILVYKL